MSVKSKIIQLSEKISAWLEERKESPRSDAGEAREIFWMAFRLGREIAKSAPNGITPEEAARMAALGMKLGLAISDAMDD